MTTSAVLSGGTSATQVREALLVWVESTTVGAARKRLTAQLNKSRAVFGRYAETSQPGVTKIVQELAELDGQPDHATLIPAPHTFGTTPASHLLPRGARVVGWLDADGYRGVADAPQPCPEWLDDRRAELS
jgi:hypothetical protein